jgi:hypothetical protein
MGSRRREERKEGYEARVMGQWKKREDGLRGAIYCTLWFYLGYRILQKLL